MDSTAHAIKVGTGGEAIGLKPPVALEFPWQGFVSADQVTNMLECWLQRRRRNPPSDAGSQQTSENKCPAPLPFATGTLAQETVSAREAGDGISSVPGGAGPKCCPGDYEYPAERLWLATSLGKARGLYQGRKGEAMEN